MNTVEPVVIGGHAVGPGHPCLVVAEVGLNHNGDIGLAHELIDAAAGAGAGAVKFQSYRTEDFVAGDSLSYGYTWAGGTVRESQYELFKRCELPPGVLAELRSHCVKRAVAFLGTPTSESGIEDLVAAGSHAIKNGSDFLTHLPLIAAMARTGRPVVMSAGMATLDEVDDAVKAFRGAGGGHLVLLHCTSAYPTPASDIHLRKMATLAGAFDCPVGLSDHSDGIAVATAAVALGACMLEKHFTLDRDLRGPDHHFSADPGELADMVAAVRTVEAALGNSAIEPAQLEISSRAEFRLSCVAAVDLPAGVPIGEDQIAFRRPGTGVPPRGAARFVGRRLSRPATAGTMLALDDLLGD